MNLDESQKQKVRLWLEEGLKLAEIQTKLAAEFGLRATYMEMRFLLDDLKLKPKDPEPVQPPPDLPKEPSAPLASDTPAASPGQLGKVSVTVDQIARPGALVSGNVAFSDGQSAEWYLDQTGRLGVTPKEKGYKPAQEDVMAFQTELQNELAKMGF